MSGILERLKLIFKTIHLVMKLTILVVLAILTWIVLAFISFFQILIGKKIKKWK
jgi:hypothetical protein